MAARQQDLAGGIGIESVLLDIHFHQRLGWLDLLGLLQGFLGHVSLPNDNLPRGHCSPYKTKQSPKSTVKLEMKCKNRLRRRFCVGGGWSKQKGPPASRRQPSAF
jgi:hypothetical protein